MRRASQLFLFVFATLMATGQQTTYFSAEAAATNDLYKITDPAGGLKTIPLLSGMLGFSFCTDINKHLFFETGLLRKYYSEGIGFKAISSSSGGNAMNAWLIPLKFGTRLNLSKEKIHLVPVLGVVAGFNSDYGNGNGGQGGMVSTPHDSIHYSYVAHYDYSKNYYLLQTCLGLEFHLFQNVLLSLSGEYYFGMNKLIQEDISYTINNNPSQTATAISKGSMIGFAVAFRYPISNIWNKGKN
ncbi:MAG: hypothetical protein ACJ75B_20800 [Flavisolibacter sp.]